jgi:hypothetical protein
MRVCLFLLIPALTASAKEIRFSNRAIEAAFDDTTAVMRVTDKRVKRNWQQQAFTGAPAPKSVALKGPGLVAAEFDAFRAEFALVRDRPEIEITVTGAGALEKPASFPHPFVTEKGTSLIVPMNEGIHYPVDDEAITPRQLIAYGGHGICMPWFGVMDAKGAGLMTILETPDDARIDITRQPGAGLIIRPMWDPSRGEYRYPRKARYILLDRGGYGGMAKRYREHAREAGLYKSLKQKLAENPNVDLLVGAANIWNWDMDKVALSREMKEAGMERILWSSGGKPHEIDAINKLGFLSSRYDIFQDVWPPETPGARHKEGWPDDLVLLPNGDWMKGWAIHRTNPDGTKSIYPGGVISSPRQVARAKQRIPAELKTHAYRCYFIDTTTASPWREDYHPQHQLTRSEDRRHKMALLEFVSKELKLVTGTETGIDPSVPFVHYYEGMLSLGPYRLPDAGRDMIKYKPPTPDYLKFQVGHYYRIPLWELVYHDCVVSQWYWGDYNNKTPEVWDRRDLFNMLYGTPPMYMFTREYWQANKEKFVASYKNVVPLARRVGYDEMISHEWLTPDHAVQRTRYSSGAEVVVNFGASEFKLPDGRSIPAMGSLVR